MVGVGTKVDPYRAKYTDDPAVIAAGSIRYSNVDHAVALIDAPQVYLDFVAAQPDATLLATNANLDQVLTAGQANAAQTIFESAGIPANFINAGDTRRQAIRGVIGMFLFSQRLEGRFGVGFKAKAAEHGVTLSSTWSSFPQALQDVFIEIRDTFWPGNNLGITGASTLRQILVAVSQAWGSHQFVIAGVSI